MEKKEFRSAEKKKKKKNEMGVKSVFSKNNKKEFISLVLNLKNYVVFLYILQDSK